MRNTQLMIALAAMGFAGSALATNGMNLEGYGPIAAAMGGASMAYDNGNAATMNNPATLGLMGQGSRLDLAVGMLGPDVKVKGGQSSDGDAYYMPAIGFSRKDGALTYGVAMFAQGGMGTEFDMGFDGLKERSELGVGRLIFPLAYNVNSDLTIGGSLDFVWAMLDMRMSMPLGNMMAPTPGTMVSLITRPPSGNLAMAMGQLTPDTPVRLDFSDSSDYTGRAKGTGYAGKIGFTYKASPTVTIGGTYHSKTHLDDLETNSKGAKFVVGGGMMSVPGKLKVHDFEWPETFGVGIAVQATPTLMVAADVKRIGWKEVMKKFTMSYSAMGDSVTFSLPQDWDNQTVFSLGMSYKATDALTLRGGVNLSDNPIPDETMHYLFPAIVKNHYTAGVGYAFDQSSDINFSLQYAPSVKQTNSTFGYTVSHGQTSWQLMYSKRF
jgi:long-chain fatty acid transport protein